MYSNFNKETMLLGDKSDNIAFIFNKTLMNSVNFEYRRQWVRVEVIDFINKYEFTIQKDKQTILDYFEIAQNDALKLKL